MSTHGEVILSLFIEHGLEKMNNRRDAWAMLQNISCCNEYLCKYIKQRLSRLRLAIMGTFVVGKHPRFPGIKVTCYEKNGLRHGICRIYTNNHGYPDEETYENGKRHGQTRLYHFCNPVIWKTVSYCNNRHNGLEVVYYENGKLREIEYRKPDGTDSHAIKYNQNGSEQSDNWEKVKRLYKKQKLLA